MTDQINSLFHQYLTYKNLVNISPALFVILVLGAVGKYLYKTMANRLKHAKKRAIERQHKHADHLINKIEKIEAIIPELMKEWLWESAMIKREDPIPIIPDYDNLLSELRRIINSDFRHDNEINSLMKEIADLESQTQLLKIEIAHDPKDTMRRFRASQIIFKIASCGNNSKLSELLELLIRRKEQYLKTGKVN